MQSPSEKMKARPGLVVECDVELFSSGINRCAPAA